MSVGLLFSAHLLSTIYMTGLIWFVQLVHYPLFAHVSAENFPEYEAKHQARTSFVVVPAMLTEMATGVLLLFKDLGLREHQLSYQAFLVSLALLLIIWISTFLIQVPLHAKLEKVFDLRSIERLVQSNWIRTFAWSARSLILLYILSEWQRITP